MAQKVEEAKKEQQCAVERIKKRRLEETNASSAPVAQGDDTAANAKAGHVPTSKSYSAVASQAAAQTAASGNGATSQAQASQKPKEEDAELQAIKEGCLATARAKMAKQLAKQ